MTMEQGDMYGFTHRLPQVLILKIYMCIFRDILFIDFFSDDILWNEVTSLGQNKAI